jgi:hypothetical protein
MKINDNRKPYQTTIGGQELTSGKTYECVEPADSKNIAKGDVVIAGLYDKIRTSIYSTNLATGGVISAGDSIRFIPVDAEVTVK